MLRFCSVLVPLSHLLVFVHATNRGLVNEYTARCMNFHTVLHATSAGALRSHLGRRESQCICASVHTLFSSIGLHTYLLFAPRPRLFLVASSCSRRRRCCRCTCRCQRRRRFCFCLASVGYQLVSFRITKQKTTCEKPAMAIDHLVIGSSCCCAVATETSMKKRCLEFRSLALPVE